MLPDRAFYLPTFSHFLIVKETSSSPSSSLLFSHFLIVNKSSLSRAGWGSIPVVFPWDGRSPGPVSHHTCDVPVSHLTCDGPFPPRRSGGYRKGMISPDQGVRGSVWDPEPSRERISRGFGCPNRSPDPLVGRYHHPFPLSRVRDDWGGPETVWALLCVADKARHKTKRRMGV